ncbi:MAG: hypothetical protein ACREOG_16355 [Gemmatimonadaceae bacterium]
MLIGMLLLFAGTIPRNLLFAANLRYYASVPWQASSGPVALVWKTGADTSFWISGLALLVVAAAAAWAYFKLARAARPACGV